MIFTAKIKSRLEIAKNTWEITIINNEPNFYFNAGQYVWVITPVGRRAFSISSSSKNPTEIQIIFRGNDKSGIKNYLINPKNTDVSIRGPFGFLKFPVNEKSIYITGGVGIAPILSIIRRMGEENLIPDIELIFANHTKEDVFYLDEIQKLMAGKFKNVIGKISDTDVKIDKISKYYVLGSQEMVNGVSEILNKLKAPTENIIFEENRPSVPQIILNTDDKSYFKLATDQSINHIVMTNLNGVITYANAAAQATTGYSFAEMQGQSPRLWGGMMDKETYESFWKTLLIDKKPFKGEFKNQRKNGEEYYVVIMVSPIIDDTGKHIGFLGIEQDITEMKLAGINSKKLEDLMVSRESAMIQLKDEIARLKGAV